MNTTIQISSKDEGPIIYLEKNSYDPEGVYSLRLQAGRVHTDAFDEGDIHSRYITRADLEQLSDAIDAILCL